MVVKWLLDREANQVQVYQAVLCRDRFELTMIPSYPTWPSYAATEFGRRLQLPLSCPTPHRGR